MGSWCVNSFLDSNCVQNLKTSWIIQSSCLWSFSLFQVIVMQGVVELWEVSRIQESTHTHIQLPWPPSVNNSSQNQVKCYQASLSKFEYTEVKRFLFPCQCFVPVRCLLMTIWALLARKQNGTTADPLPNSKFNKKRHNCLTNFFYTRT